MSTEAGGAFGWYRPWLRDVQDSDAPMRAKALAAVLARAENTNREGSGCVRRTAGWLGARCSCDEKTARLALADLANGGWITRHRSRDHIVITLIPSSGVTPELTSENGRETRTSSGDSSGQIGTDARPRSGVTPDSPTRDLHDLVPPAPASGGAGERGDELEVGIPCKPTTGRHRDRQTFDVELDRYAAAYFSDIEPHAARGYIRRAIAEQPHPTHDSIAEYVRHWTRQEAA